ncbi:MAG: ssDNA-binding domain-containing protein [Planctomycetes bacterium]|nr:ssDNA-binding domain-containing protein [Planctomycetota bacterium]
MTTTTETTARVDIYTRVTNRIVEALEAGHRPWLKPWNAEHAAGRIMWPLRHNGTPYSGINVICLWMEAETRGFVSPYWLTYKQAQELGGHVRKGEHGAPVVYANTFTKKEAGENGDEVEREIPFLKQYTVFAADQIEGLPGHYYELAHTPTETLERIAQADEFFKHTGADVRIGGNRAFYALEPDYIRLPPFETFRDAESHAATLAHELAHWTRHPSRLDRDLGRKKWGDEGYAMEELVAEMGSAFLCADLQLTPETREDHAAYIASWLKVLKDDKRAVFSAASYASKAVEFLHGLQPKLVE